MSFDSDPEDPFPRLFGRTGKVADNHDEGVGDDKADDSAIEDQQSPTDVTSTESEQTVISVEVAPAAVDHATIQVEVDEPTEPEILPQANDDPLASIESKLLSKRPEPAPGEAKEVEEGPGPLADVPVVDPNVINPQADKPRDPEQQNGFEDMDAIVPAEPPTRKQVGFKADSGTSDSSERDVEEEGQGEAWKASCYYLGVVTFFSLLGIGYICRQAIADIIYDWLD